MLSLDGTRRTVLALPDVKLKCCSESVSASAELSSSTEAKRFDESERSAASRFDANLPGDSDGKDPECSLNFGNELARLAFLP